MDYKSIVMTRIISFIIFILLPSLLEAAIIKGKVTDGENRPVAFATVMLLESRKVVSADKNGMFVIDNITNGKYILKVTCLGYSPKEDSIRVSDGNIDCNVVLKESSIQLKEVVATSTDMTGLILNKLASVPKLKKLKKEFRAKSDCRIESLGNLDEFPKQFLSVLRFYSSLLGFKTMFRCMERNRDLCVEINCDVNCKGGKLYLENGHVKKCNYDISEKEKQAFVKKATKAVGGYYDDIYNTIRRLKKNNEKKDISAADKLCYSGSYRESGKVIHVLKSKDYEIQVVADCWQVYKMISRNKKSKSIVECTEAYKDLYLPVYIHNSSVYDMDEKTEWDWIDTTVFSYPDTDR